MTRELAMVHAREGIRLNALCPYVFLNLLFIFYTQELTYLWNLLVDHSEPVRCSSKFEISLFLMAQFFSASDGLP